MRILDAGCGEGRNTIYFLQQGYAIFGVDSNPIAVQMARMYAQTIQKNYDIYRFQTATVEDMPFHQSAFDAVISSAVLHFATGTDHFLRMFGEMIRVLKPGGVLFLRMCMEVEDIKDQSQALGNGIFSLPDGSRRFLLTKSLLKEIMEKHQLQYLEPPKSVLVHDQRAMGVLVWEKNENLQEKTKPKGLK